MKILLAHADLRAGGGAEACAEAFYQAVKRRGHQIDRLDITGLQSRASGRRPWFFRLGDLPRLRNTDLFKHLLVSLELTRLAHGYDRILLTKGEAPALASPTFTLLHYPPLFSTSRVGIAYLTGVTATPVGLAGRRLLIGIARLLTGKPRTRTAWVMANSAWTARQLARLDGAPPPPVLYPPVRRPAQVPSAKRGSHRLVCIGRLVKNKRPEDAIRIADLLHKKGLPVELDLVGRAVSPYARKLMCEHEHKPYLRFFPDAGPERLAELLAEARFGLHCFRHEHFGISVAEMILAGVVPLVYDGGGVRELVTQPELRFLTTEDAAERLLRLFALDMRETDALAATLQQGDALSQALDFDARLDAVLDTVLAEPD